MAIAAKPVRARSLPARLVLVVAALTLLGAAGNAARLRWSNFAVVDEGRFFRSAQLTPDRLARLIDARGIRTIVNLRGAKPGRRWYREEREVARAKGVHHVDVRWSAERLPHRESLLELLDVYARAERPILVHCLSGADRAGEAAAIYQIEYMGRSAEQAAEMLSLRFLHLAWLRPAKRHFLGLYRGEAWARAQYHPCSGDYPHYDVDRYCNTAALRRRGAAQRL